VARKEEEEKLISRKLRFARMICYFLSRPNLASSLPNAPPSGPVGLAAASGGSPFGLLWIHGWENRDLVGS